MPVKLSVGGAIAIGAAAGRGTQAADAIAIGTGAGQTSQGAKAIAIGELAGGSGQGANSIVLNASGLALNGTTANKFYVKPVASGSATTNPLYYNTTTGEIYYVAPKA